MNNLTILVSPHPDDVALSLGGMIVGDLLPKPLIGVTAFTKSAHVSYGYTGVSPLIEGILPTRYRSVSRLKKKLVMMEITRHRKREDLRFFKSRDIPYIDLNLLEAPLRGHRHIMRVSHLLERDIAAIEAIRSAVSKLTSKVETGYIIIPLGLRNHIDHKIVRDACLGVCGNLCPVFYEDLPYAADISLEEIDKAVTLLDSSLCPQVFDIQEYLETKIDNLRFYSSQIGKRQIYRTVLHAQRLGASNNACERVWLSANCKANWNTSKFQ